MEQERQREEELDNERIYEEHLQRYSSLDIRVATRDYQDTG